MEIVIFVFKKELVVIYEYGEVFNCFYVLYLFYREFKEFIGVKRFLNNFKYLVFTYIDLVLYIVFVNFGNIVVELEYNYK